MHDTTLPGLTQPKSRDGYGGKASAAMFDCAEASSSKETWTGDRDVKTNGRSGRSHNWRNIFLTAGTTEGQVTVASLVTVVIRKIVPIKRHSGVSGGEQEVWITQGDTTKDDTKCSGTQGCQAFQSRAQVNLPSSSGFLVVLTAVFHYPKRGRWLSGGRGNVVHRDATMSYCSGWHQL